MKKEFLKICKDLGQTIKSYKTYRSDFGCQVYEIILGNHVFHDSYIIGERNGKERLLERFKDELSSL